MDQSHMRMTEANVQTLSRSHRDGQARAKCNHAVQFYNDDARLVDTVVDYIGDALQAGDGAVVLATQAHRDGFEEGLRAAGIDMDAARASGRYVAFDAADTLAQIMADGQPDPQRFDAVCGNVMRQALAISPRVDGFGELVSLLWSTGQASAAITLEKLWNGLLASHPVSLLCAYEVHDLGTHVSGDYFAHVCAEHRKVLHSPSYVGSALVL